MEDLPQVETLKPDDRDFVTALASGLEVIMPSMIPIQK